MIGRIGERLGLHWGTRAKSGEERGRPYAFDQSIDRRATFNAVVQQQKEPLKPGDAVLSHGYACELGRIIIPDGAHLGNEPEAGWPCVITFRGEGASEEKQYSCMYGNGAGSARLQHVPPSLAPPPRSTPKDDEKVETRRLIREHALELCAISPVKRDQKRRHVGPRLWITRPALVLLMPVYAMYALFEALHSGRCKLSQFKNEFNDVCWEAIHAYREGCLCRACFNHRCYREALAVVAKLLALILQPPPNSQQADGSSGAVEWQPDLDVKRLHDFCQLTLMSQVGNQLVCAARLEDADAACLRGECPHCGFQQLWTKTLRPKLVDSFGKLKPDISRIWLTKMQWDRLKTGGDGSSSEDDLRQARAGTLLELLDEFKPIQDSYIPHRFNIGNAKIAARECDENVGPGVIDEDSDYSENGSIVKKRQIQSEYWIMVYYTLLISIASFLVSKFWIDRESKLPPASKVTVELEGEGASVPANLKPGPGSYFATVESGPDANGAYVVVRPSGECATVSRALLRHRQKHRIAFLQFTNDTTHDGFASQAFARRRMQFFSIWNEQGRLAALDFARNDRAEQSRSDEQAKLDAARASDAAALAAALAAATANPAGGEDIADGVDDEADDAAQVAAAAAAAADAAVVAAAATIAAGMRKSSAYDIPVPRAARRRSTDSDFSSWLLALDTEKFWAWIEHSDNAVHFKSKENLYFWSQQLEQARNLPACLHMPSLFSPREGIVCHRGCRGDTGVMVTPKCHMTPVSCDTGGVM